MGTQRLDPIATLRLAPFGVHLGIDVTGAHRIHTKALLSNFLRQADRERLDRSLAGGIVNVLVRQTGQIIPGFPLASLRRVASWLEVIL